MNEITLGNTIILYTLRQSERAHGMRLSINIDKGFVVTTPKHLPITEVEQFLRQKQNWILKQMKRIEEQKQLRPNRLFKHGEEIEFLGKKYPLHIEKYAGQRIMCALRYDMLLIKIPDDTTDADEHPYAKRVIDAWMRHQAKYYISKRVHELNRTIGFEYRRITIKDQKSKWGSCSRQKNLNFNFRLMMAPPEVVDYIIFHELMHLKELNHSKSFYTLLKKFCPNYREHEKWLKQHGVSLVL